MLQVGDRVEGKWGHQHYRVSRCLGAGSNGEVFLVKGTNGSHALKACDRAGDIAFEWGLLDKLQHQTNCFPKPVLIDDDNHRTNVYFYVMEFVQGQPLDRAFPLCSEADIRALTIEILRGLTTLHQTGHAFCDIKPQNIMVQLDTMSVRFVDVGGVTPFGRSVRQFTPFYDRAFWGLGSRQADASYDLAGLALALICLSNKPPNDVASRTERDRQQWLNRALAKYPWPSAIPVLQAALNGKLDQANSFLEAINRSWTQKSSLRHPRSPRAQNRRTKHDWTERLMWFSLASATVVTMLAWASFFGWV